MSVDRQDDVTTKRPRMGDIIRERREELQFSQDEFATRLGGLTSPSDIQRLESMHIIMPSWPRLQRIAETLDLPIEALLAGVDGYHSEKLDNDRTSNAASQIRN